MPGLQSALPDDQGVWRIAVCKTTGDPEARSLEAVAQDLGITNIGPVRITRVFYLEGLLQETDVQRMAQELFCDPVCETAKVTGFQSSAINTQQLEVFYNPGVMDPSVAAILRALEDMGFPHCRVRTSRAYEFGRRLSEGEENLLVKELLINPLIQHRATCGERVFAQPTPYQFRQQIISLRGKSDGELKKISEQGLLALSLEEMRALKDYYERLGRDPTDVELETFAQTWSEHCQHKTFRGEICYNDQLIKNLLKSTIFRVTEELAPSWVLSAFHDNSGVIEFDSDYGITFKVETHNHPSALEPYGGAATGIGGVIRDCLGTGLGAKPILNTDVFCFGYITTEPEDVPKGVLHPKRVMKGVVAGVRDYGNRMGIPTANGAVYFDQGFIGNPLVFCGTMGLIPKKKLKKRVRKGQLIILLGGRTGRDGIHGVTFASLELNKDSTMASSAVQIGNPIEEKKLADLVLAAREQRLFSAITDCGGGGLSSAVGELAKNHGCEVWLERVPLKYPGLTPAEIWISEAQERMVVFTEPERAEELLTLAREHDVEATVIGQVTNTKRLVLKFQNRIVGDIEMRFLHHGWQVARRNATWRRPDTPEGFVRPGQDLNRILLKLLQSPNIASKEWITRQYDHEVQAGSGMKPFSGQNNSGPTDACVVLPLFDSRRAVVVGCGLCPRYSLVDPYWMAASAIDEALRNCIAAGGNIERTALLDNFCWGSPDRPETLGGLVRAAQACYDIAKGYRVPFISGKDSLYNEFKTEEGQVLPIPGTLLISAVSIIPDVGRTVTPDFKEAGSLLFLVGETFEELGGSEYLRLHQGLGSEVPKVDARRGRRLMKALGKAIHQGLVRACHDLSEGGLGVALAEMGLGSGLGCTISLKKVPGAHRFRRDDLLLFSESNTRFLCEVPAAQRSAFEQLLHNIPHGLIGRTHDEPRLNIIGLHGKEVVRLDLHQALKAWRNALTRRL
ncbi:MAG: phosphoribosylformylglycinamidine synthase subunit PurL [candidate division WOR-3 bacterium]